MTAREVVTLNEATPQLEVPQAGDTYILPRDVSITGNLAITGTVDGIDISVVLGTAMQPAVYDAAAITEQLVGLTATQSLTNKTLNSLLNTIHADAIHIASRNESGSEITKGTPVYISGYSIGEDVVLVDLADASIAATMPALGIAENDIANNADK